MPGAVTLATEEWNPPLPDRATRRRVAVLVHGVTGWWRTWWRVGPALSAVGWQVVAVDQRGHGRSPRIDGTVTVGELAEDLAAVIERMGAPADAVIGHSLGAAVTSELAYRRPELVQRIVLEDPPSISRAGDTGWLANLERELIQARLDPEGEVTRELTENPLWLEEDARQDVEGKALADADGLLATFRQPTGARVLELAPQLAVPALYIMASEDRSVFIGDARLELRAGLPPHSRLIEIEAGHTIHRDCFDDYIAALREWLEPPSLG